jgi:membrane fusion protein (multidrug efflux system)
LFRHRLTGHIVALTCIAVAGCDGTKPAATPRAAPEVVIVTVTPEAVTLRSELPGRTAAHSSAEIRPQVSGIVRRRLFNEGALVSAGQVLYEIDPAPFAAAAEQQAAALADAEAGARVGRLLEQRYRTLLPQGTISQQDYDNAAAALAQADARVRVARAATNAARINLQWTRVASPIAGRTGRSLVTPGALVSASQAEPLTIVSQLDPIYVDLTQSSADLLRLRQGLQQGSVMRGTATRAVRLRLEDGSPYPHEGRLELSEVTVDPSTGSVALRAVFPNPDGLLLPGMYVRAEVDEGVNPEGIRVPQQAIVRDRKGNATVRLVDAEGRLQVRPVVVSRVLDNAWLVDSGLAAGERVVIEGGTGTAPGSEVRVVDGAAP